MSALRQNAELVQGITAAVLAEPEFTGFAITIHYDGNRCCDILDVTVYIGTRRYSTARELTPVWQASAGRLTKDVSVSIGRFLGEYRTLQWMKEQPGSTLG